ncbi:type-F conjugative transfer system protein TraW [Candidatus Tisiphia endosymbiont of Metellina segmentata]|uniref:type-F conjugative transfer system protein TraW n=1 Tax=Candidatus Tisiphia endosymbiont of Metellina segmentata TaxID=3066274 RepID=UPI00313EFE60
MSFSLVRLILSFCFSTIVASNSLAEDNRAILKDYGIRGHSFPIIEQSLLEIIMTKLKIAQQSGSLEKMQDEFKEKVKEKIARPAAVLGLHKATKDRSWTYDPTFTQKTDIKDQTGKIIIKAGTKINPLETISWGEPLILIDGDDKEQVAWAKSKIGKLVLTKGNPSQLAQQLNQHVFFDQGGTLTTRFKIKTMPAIVKQEGSLLKISEIKIN